MPTLDLSAPLESLRAHTPPTAEERAARTYTVNGDGLTQSELARRRGVDRRLVAAAEKAQNRITLANLAAYAEAAGYVLEIHLRRK